MIGEAAILEAEARARAATTLSALAFTIANETRQLVDYRQALVWREGLAGATLEVVSGLAMLPEDSVFTVWVRRLGRAWWPQLTGAPRLVDLSAVETAATGTASAAGLTAEVVSGWQEWWPPYLVAVPLAKDGARLGAAFFLFEAMPDEATLAVLVRLQETWSYCAWALTRERRRLPGLRMPTRRVRWVALAALAATLFVPVRQTVLASAEIVALKAVAVASPLDGVVQSFDVRPNQPVKAGEALFSLDDTTLRNRREVAARAVEVTAADLFSAQQKAFDDGKARAEVATLQGRLAERRAELQAVEEQLDRVRVSAPREGIAVFGDTNDWEGRPVVVGERIMQLADPADAGVLIYLPVADAIALDVGARVRIFLHVAPLSPLEATLSETSYLATLSPDGIASYRLRGTLASADVGRARIGLKGTAKLYGRTVPLGYMLFRRPIAAFREWSGL